MGCLLYSILPIQMAIDQFYERQMCAAEVAAERQRAEQRRATCEQKRGEAVC